MEPSIDDRVLCDKCGWFGLIDQCNVVDCLPTCPKCNNSVRKRVNDDGSFNVPMCFNVLMNKLANGEIIEMKPVVCVDLDGTLLDYNGWKGITHFGEARPGAILFMHNLRKIARVMVYTTRTSMDAPGRPAGMTVTDAAELVANALRERGIEFDGVYSGNGKPLCCCFVDDRNVAIRSNPEPDDYMDALRMVRRFVDKEGK